MCAMRRREGARGDLDHQAGSDLARELPEMWRKHQIQKKRYHAKQALTC
jgi:hypothetical protein